MKFLIHNLLYVANQQFKNKNLPPQKAISSQKIIFAFL